MEEMRVGGRGVHLLHLPCLTDSASELPRRRLAPRRVLRGGRGVCRRRRLRGGRAALWRAGGGRLRRCWRIGVGAGGGETQFV